MSTRKAVKQDTAPKPTQLNFLVPLSNKRATKMVSVRVDEELLNQFKEAATKAEAAGYDLSMTTVVHNAIRMALDAVDGIAGTTEAPSPLA